MQENFSEQDYLDANPDVAEAVRRKECKSGFVHWKTFGKQEGRRLSTATQLPAPSANDMLPHMVEDKFVTTAPSAQNIIDIFQGEWSTKMPSGSNLFSKPGQADLFNDYRVLWTDQVLGPLRGMRIVELGPLEGAHSRMLEELGAQSVDAIESNTRSFLKCLCVKEIFDLKHVNFKLGDFLPYLDGLDKVDLIFASGVLYHMVDPLRLLDLICTKTDKFFLWTHYYDESLMRKRADKDLFDQISDIDASGYMGSKRLYPEAALSWKGFCGGAHAYAIWMERQSLLQYIADRGFAVKVDLDQIDHPNGPALAICAHRTAAALQEGSVRVG